MISRTYLLASATIFAGAIVLASSAGAVGSGMVGDPGVHRTAGDDTLLDIAHDHDVGYVAMIAANPVIDPWVPGAGRDIVLPTQHILPDAPHEGIVVNIA